jgi:hypothetical protein
MEHVSDPAQWKTLREYIDSGAAGRLFPSFSSLEWFVRQHRAELIQRNVYVPRAGRAGSLVAPAFGAVALEIFRRAAGPGRAA